MSIGIEELTQEELVSWIRENVTDINEEDVVLAALQKRAEFALEMSLQASKRRSAELIELSEWFDGELKKIKPGGTGRKLREDLWQEYKQRKDVAYQGQDEWEYWQHKYDITRKKIKKIMRIRNLRDGDALYEKQKERGT